jgi:hypothetical protein
VHSGSDKFSIYAPIKRALKKTGAGLHLKTAGTTWLEEIIGLALAGGEGLEIAKEVYRQALEHFDELCGPYATVIDIKKSKVSLNEQIFNYIKDSFMSAPRRAADQKYRKGVSGVISAKAQNAHAASNRNIEEKASSVEGSKVTVTNEAENEVEISNNNGTFKHKITIRGVETPGQYRVVAVDSVDAGGLWEPGIIEGHHAVLINKNHPYYQKVYYPVLQQSTLVTGMDALLWALAEAEISTFNNETREVYEEVRIQVSRALKKLVADLPDPDFRED